ncbi:hypothetical protein N7533_009773 [Penicillium manginii]|jgi:hypothetical protein|uniref:uncharacterized protein n=1 Tax=Penicillium manginii TaxID=203109 RepID=UPI002547A3FE|nr:uncharacterized protein N7533_009773 [Penicillium manginii]KAJ5744903.1 hypothetical protein N7533_009773 [Penicillium manginii]
MTSPFYNYTLATFIRGLNTLHYILKKGEDHAKEHNIDLDELHNARIAEDMQPLAFQVVTATNNVGKALARASFTDPPPQYSPDETYEGLYTRIERYIVELKAVDARMCASREGQTFTAPIGMDTFEYTLEEYSVRFSIPNFYFHLVTAYAILRSKGVEIGKLDYLNQFTA